MPDGTDILRKVVQSTNQDSGRDFFRSLTRGLANGLGVRYCFVTECLDSPPSRVATLAFWAGQDFDADIDYSLLGTPCERVIKGHSCVFGEKIQALFPDDKDLVELEAESYAAAPLIGTAGDVIGHLVVLDSQPFAEPPDLSLLELFAARAAAELERQRATVRLANSEARLRQVIDLVPHFIFAKDGEGRFILANQAIADAYGITVADLVGKTDADFAAAQEEVENFLRDDREVIESGQIKVIPEETITDASGRERLLQTTKIPFHFADSDLPSVLGVSTDITELRRTEKVLRSIVEGTAATVGEAFLQSLARHLARALGTRYAMVAELDGNLVRARAIWGADSFLPTMEYPMKGSPCEHVARSRTSVFFRQDLQQTFPDHPILSFLDAESYFGAPLFDVDQQPIGLLAVLDPDPMEDSVQNSDLLSIFAARAAAEIERERLEAHRRKLQSQVLHVQKLESLGVLAGGIAHDFNNLLCGILGNVELAMMRVTDDSELRAYLRGIKTAADRSAELANQMLAYSGKGKFVITTIDLNRLVEEMLGLLSASIKKKARLHFHPASQIPAFHGDTTQIRQVVMNLVVNASDALGDAPGQVHIRTGVCEADRAYLDEAYLAEQLSEGTYLFIEVEDDGCGMDAETRDHLFDPFFTTKDTGRGLGLASLLGIVRGHHGAVKVSSLAGEGSSFRILLPLSNQCQPEEAPASTLTPDTGWHGAGKILLVDDEDVVRLVTRKMLEKLGFEVLVAENGRQGVKVFQRHGPDISAVVLDMMMPEFDGLETFRELKRLDSEVKVLLVSGYSHESIITSLEKEGLVGFLQKPVRYHQFEDKLREILG